jgi:hypothetical protein
MLQGSESLSLGGAPPDWDTGMGVYHHGQCRMVNQNSALYHAWKPLVGVVLSTRGHFRKQNVKWPIKRSTSTALHQYDMPLWPQPLCVSKQLFQ